MMSLYLNVVPDFDRFDFITYDFELCYMCREEGEEANYDNKKLQRTAHCSLNKGHCTHTYRENTGKGKELAN